MPRGRPPIENPKNVVTNIRQTSDEKVSWDSVAKSHGMKLSEFVRFVVNRYVDRAKKSQK